MKEKRSERDEWLDFLKKEPFDELEKRAKAGDADAQFNLAVCYQAGAGTRRNLKKAAYWFSQAAEQDDAESLYELGLCYDDGLGVSHSQKRAAACYEKAAKLGNVDAQCAIGYAYAGGMGVARNEALSAYWFGRSAEGGQAEAQFNLAQCFADGEGVPQDDQKAFYWYSRAAEGGDVLARVNVAYYYIEGVGVEADEKHGFELLQHAAAQLPPDTPSEEMVCYYCILAECYEAGKGVERDLKKAERILLKAAKEDDIRAYDSLVHFYYKHQELDVSGRKTKHFLHELARLDESKDLLVVACAMHTNKKRKGFESMEKLFLDAMKGLPCTREEFNENRAHVRYIAKRMEDEDEREPDAEK